LTPIGLTIVLFIAGTMALGIYTSTKIQGRATNYYVAGNSMPVWIIGITLCAQAFDANGSMGNAALSHSNGFWTGAVIPLGLAGCLFLTGWVFAGPIHRMHLMTLPDFYRRRYSQSTETLAAVSMLVSNIVLVAGNLAGLGLLLDLVFDAGYLMMLIVVSACILAYAVTGGLYATITTSVVQVGIFIVGSLLALFWLVGDHGLTSMMSQVPTQFMDMSGLLDAKRGALVNWAALISLLLGDIVAIDFMQRVISADSTTTARRGCYVAGMITLVVGLAVSLVGMFAFYLGKAPSQFLLVDIALNDLPGFVGGLLLLGVIAASMSTAAGVVLDLANLITRNLVQRYIVTKWNDQTMLRFSRLIALPTMAAAVIFAYLRPEPGVLLILAFDIVLASCFVPLALGFFWKQSNTPGAIAGIVMGATARLALFFALPDGYDGLDTLCAPLVSLFAFVLVSLTTQGRSKPKHVALEYVPTDEELVSGAF
jgi:Na+/proline symporter